MSNTKNIFISHTHEDDPGCRKLKELVKKNGLDARDYSITKDKPNQAKSENYIKSNILAPQIMQSSCLVVYLTKNTEYSKWVKWETEYASKNGKRIVAVYANGEKHCTVPPYIHRYANSLVGWNGDSIVDAINGKKDSFENVDGSPHTKRIPENFVC